tara:strand:+ start:288 stop:551 length:264 start_codon:yes stop_codon:yes gene_type:complete
VLAKHLNNKTILIKEMAKPRVKSKKPILVKDRGDTIDIILYEIRDLRKEVGELKSFVNKSKGTVAIVVFIVTIIATVTGAVNWFSGK